MKSVVRTVLLTVFVAGCTPAPSASPSPSPGPTPSPTPAVSTSALPSNAQGVVVDPTLLEILPEAVGGIPIVESQEAEAQLLGDPALGTIAEAVAAGLAVDAQAAQTEFLYAVVVRLREGQMGEERFRDWRDSYDEGACTQAGGVVGNAQAEIDSRTVYIGTCDGAVRTYHVWLPEPNLLVSASAVGVEKRLGEELVENLRP